MIDIGEWKGAVGETWSQEWRRTDRSFGPLTEKLLGRVRRLDFNTLADIGCGAGELAIAIARSRPDASVTGVDVSRQLISAARARGEHHPNLDFACADAAMWKPVGERTPELLVSRHGVMFFDDPRAVFAHLAAVASGNAKLLFSCFRDPHENAFVTEILRLLPDPPSLDASHAPGPFAFADKQRVSAILATSGWTDIRIDPFDFAMIVGAGEDPLDDAVSYFSRIGPAARIAAEMDVPARERFFDRVRNLAESYRAEGVVAMPAATWLVTARKR